MRPVCKAAAACVLTACAGAASAGTYTAGNLVVSQMGDGSVALSNAAAPIVLREWSLGVRRFSSTT